MRLSIFLGDIADAPADALCTSTNPRLSLMMGTGASVRFRGGPSILQACQGVPSLPPGAVHVTTAGSLSARIVIHCVASDASHRSSLAIVRACVSNALAAADAAGCATVAMPLFGTGHARLPFLEVARIMALAALAGPTHVREVKLVTNDDEQVESLRSLLASVTVGPIEVVRSPRLEDEPTSFWADEYSLDVS